MSNIKLEVGKRYVCRDSADIKYVEIIYKTNNPAYPFVGITTFHNDAKLHHVNTYMECGGLSVYDNCEEDLVAEYVESRDIELWINIYSDMSYNTYLSENTAKRGAAHNIVARKHIKFTYTPGEGLD